MSKKLLPIMGMMLALAGCQTASDEVITETDMVQISDGCITGDCSVIRYDTPNGNDLVLETAHHIIEIQSQSNIPYSYRVWSGGKSMESDPDMIIQDGETMILVEE